MKRFLAILVSSFVLFAPLCAFAAIAFDATSQGADNTVTVTWNHTVTGTNLLLALCVTDQAGDLLSTPTFNGSNMTLITKKSGAGSGYVYAYYMLNPPTGTHAFSITDGATNIKRGNAVSYTGVQQSGQPDAFNTSSGTGSGTNTVSVTVVAANSWLIDCYSDVTGTDPTYTAVGGILRGTKNGGQQYLDSNAGVSAGANSIGFSETGGSGISWANIGFSIAPVASAPTVQPSILGLVRSLWW